MLLWVAVLGTVWQRRIASRASRYVTVGGKGSMPRVTRLGRWRWVATGFVVFFIFLAVGLPYAALILGSFLKFLTANLRPSVFTLDNYTVLFVSDNFTRCAILCCSAAPAGCW